MARKARNKADLHSENPAGYYALSVSAFGDYVCVESAGTEFVSTLDADNEVRQARPYHDVGPWKSLKERWVRITDRSELLRFLVSGGHCLVTSEVIFAWWPEFFAPVTCFRYCQELPFVASDYLPPGAEDRHPSALIRKRVFARDEYRCRVCGYAPEDHSAIRLEIHHVVEHALGGLTMEGNLLTLCHNCHGSATPADAWLRDDYFRKIFVATSRFHRRSHVQGVDDYRAWVSRALRFKETESIPEGPVESLVVPDDFDERERYAKWASAYILLATNSLTRYLSFREWQRLLPRELKQRRSSG